MLLRFLCVPCERAAARGPELPHCRPHLLRHPQPERGLRARRGACAHHKHQCELGARAHTHTHTHTAARQRSQLVSYLPAVPVAHRLAHLL